MNGRLYDENDLVVTGMNGETIGTFDEHTGTVCPDVTPAAPHGFDPVEFKITFQTENGKRLWTKINQERKALFNRFCDAYIEGKITWGDMIAAADALGYKGWRVC